VENSIGLVTALSPLLGYETCTELAREALEKGCRVYDLVLTHRLLSKDDLEKLLRPENMIQPRQKTSLA
jgi:aspartate ammonia-lyase